MNLVIDIGNTKLKAGVFDNSKLIYSETFEDFENIHLLIKKFNIKKIIHSSVRKSMKLLLPDNIQHIPLSHTLRFPFTIQYKTPETLGQDRIAAVAGALELYPITNMLIIDAGTCITYDFVDLNKNYIGGSISPGIFMRFKALHNFTDGLPLITRSENVVLTGQTTIEAISGGVINGTILEVEGIINEYKKRYENLHVVLTGGDLHFFENKLKQTIFVVPELLLFGLNSILKYNA